MTTKNFSVETSADASAHPADSASVEHGAALTSDKEATKPSDGKEDGPSAFFD